MGTDKRARQKAGRAARLEQAAQTQQRSQRKRTVTGLIVVVVAVAAIAVFFVARGNNKSSSSNVAAGTSSTVAGAASTVATPTTVKGATASGDVCPKVDGSSPRTLNFTSSPKQCLEPGKAYTATIKTNVGTVVLAVDTSKAPKAANSFVFLSLYHYYDDTDLFRVAQSIDIIQGGSPHTQSNNDPGPGFTLTDEPTFTKDAQGNLTGPYKYTAGDLALANTGQANSAGGQFFFITGPNGKNLDAQGTYMIIGHVTSGLPILQKIVATAKTDPNSSTGDQTPAPPVTIKSVTITSK